MHKRIVNQVIIELVISPVGPLLIKAGDQGADPTKPEMEFVETYHGGGRSVYLPGSSLKGAIRAHCERIVRTLGGDQPSEDKVWACNPLDEKGQCRKLRDKHKENTAAIYKTSCTICQIFGSTDIAAHTRIADAHPTNSVNLEERNGVAIDRVYGSVAVGPFNFQVLTAGKFTTKITVKNFTTAQLALIALAIRDFDQQRVGIGFAKSRGLGQVNMKVKRVEIRYPTAIVDTETKQLQTLGQPSKEFNDNVVIGAGELVGDWEDYGFPESDTVNGEVQAQPDELGFGATLKFEAPEDIDALWRGCVGSWRKIVEGE